MNSGSQRASRAVILGVLATEWKIGLRRGSGDGDSSFPQLRTCRIKCALKFLWE